MAFPRRLSAKATPNVEPAGALAAAQVSMGAGAKPESRKEKGLLAEVAAPQGWGWLLRIWSG